MKRLTAIALAGALAIAPPAAFAADKTVSCSGSCTIVIERDSSTLYDKAVEAGVIAGVTFIATQAATVAWAAGAAALPSAGWALLFGF